MTPSTRDGANVTSGPQNHPMPKVAVLGGVSTRGQGFARAMVERKARAGFAGGRTMDLRRSAVERADAGKASIESRRPAIPL
mmetsp:Transcript_11466/g.22004  ORF Transcript_11466/g.22004 Transcript_11466/m.22004 type:complete len:82 (+) Transcript_11466:717-962(+)